MSDSYTCCICGNTYEKDWSDEEANKEAQRNFGVEKLVKMKIWL